MLNRRSLIGVSASSRPPLHFPLLRPSPGGHSNHRGCKLVTTWPSLRPPALAMARFKLRLSEARLQACPHVGSRHGYLAGTDQQRAVDLNEMFSDDEVRAIFAVRGGWGSARLLPLLDWETIRANPKLLIGFSDITALHLAFAAHAAKLGWMFVTSRPPANCWTRGLEPGGGSSILSHQVEGRSKRFSSSVARTADPRG
jgi:hypothetical protein